MMHKFKSGVMIAAAILSLRLFGGIYVKFDAQGGMFAVPGVTMDSGSIPDEVITKKGYADPVRIGYCFAGWSSIANPETPEELDAGFAAYYSTPVTKMTTFYAIWEQSDPIALDGNGEWMAFDGGFCGMGICDEQTACSYEVPGRGWVSFKWRLILPEGIGDEFSVCGQNETLQSDEWDWEYECAGYSISVNAYGGRREDCLAWHTARVPVVDGESSEFVWKLKAPAMCCQMPSFEIFPGVGVEIADVTWESADDFETQIVLEPCGAETMYLPREGRRFCFTKDSENRYWYEDDELEWNDGTPEWRMPARYPHLVVEPKMDGAAGYGLRTTCSMLPEMMEDEVTLLERLTQKYCYRNGGSWSVDISLWEGGQIPWTEDPCMRTGQYGQLPEPERKGCEFLGWAMNPWGEQMVSSEDWLPLESNVVLYAIWDVPLEALGGESDFSWCWFGGDYADLEPRWEYDESLGRYVWLGDQVWVCSGWAAGPDEDPLVCPVYEGGVIGGGTLDFSYIRNTGYAGYWYYDYKKDAEVYRRADVLCVVYVDGKRHGIVPMNSATDLKVEIPGCPANSDCAIDHEIVVALELNVPRELQYAYVGLDYAYFTTMFGQITWTPSAAEGEVLFDARGGAVKGPSVRTYSAGDTYGDLPIVSKPDCEFLGWFTRPDGDFESSEWGGAWERPVKASDLVVIGRTLYARWKTNLKTALKGENPLRFAGRDDSWVGTSDTFYGDKDTYSAGTTEGRFGESNVLTTVVQGRGLLRFMWQRGTSLTGAYNGDEIIQPLTVWVDGELVASCEVENEWTQVVLPILGEKKNHIVEWKYTPKGGDTLEAWAGQAASWTGLRPGAWVDDVEWLPKGEVKDFITWMKGVLLGNAWLKDELPLIEAHYTQQLTVDSQNYELVILRALTKLAQLGENGNLLSLVSRFGIVPDYQVLGRFSGGLDYDDAPLSNEVVDQVAAETVPVIESALADLEMIPSGWTGSIALDPAIYPVSVVTYVDLADVTLCKAVLKGALSALAIAESYDLSVDYMNIEMEAILDDAGLPMTFEYGVEDHPDFAKRVRDAERLAEGREILRDALETLQAFDGLMLARSTPEMHFFEYNEKDADAQQYAREEVAKMLSALNGEVEFDNDDFRYVRDFRVEKLKRPATLVPFFAGELTRRYLPTEINGNVPVFDSFPSMAFGGMFPGLTKDVVAEWLAVYGHEVEYAPNSDYEPEVRFRTFSAAIPNLGVSATEEEIKDALAGTADEKVRENITDSTSYAAYETWATKVRTSGVSLKAVKASPFSWQSFALAAPELIQNEVATDDLKVEEFKPSSEPGKFDFTVSIKDVKVGSDAVEENLKQVVGLEGADSLDAVFKSENVTIKFGQPEDGKLKFTAEPKEKDVKSFFMKLKVK